MKVTDFLHERYDITGVTRWTQPKYTDQAPYSAQTKPRLIVEGFEIVKSIDHMRGEIAKFEAWIAALEDVLNNEPFEEESDD